MWIRYFHYLLLLLLRPMCMIRGLLLQLHQVISQSTDRHIKCVNETKPYLGKGYDLQEIEVCKPIKDIYRIFGIEQKQSVIKINDGNNIVMLLKEDGLQKRTDSWHNRFRKLLVGYEKKLESYFAVVGVCLGCCIFIYRRIISGIGS